MAKGSGKVSFKRLSPAAKAARIVQPQVAKAARRSGVLQSTSRVLTKASTTGSSSSKK